MTPVEWAVAFGIAALVYKYRAKHHRHRRRHHIRLIPHRPRLHLYRRTRQASQRRRRRQYRPVANMQAYYQTPWWHHRKTQVLERDHHRCRACGVRGELAVHHLRYTNLGHEPDADLVSLCQPHHDEVHRIAGRGRHDRIPAATERVLTGR